MVKAMSQDFTEEQLADFKAFRFVQNIGKYNMLDPCARKATGMTMERYSFTMDNYKALREASEKPLAEIKQEMAQG
jgi:hypothetical protein